MKRDMIIDTAIKLIEAKNNDYSANDDALINFKRTNFINVSPDIGILVRLIDKVSRYEQLSKNEANVKSESLKDTLLDVINYLVIFHILKLKSDKKLKQSEFLELVKNYYSGLKFETKNNKKYSAKRLLSDLICIYEANNNPILQSGMINNVIEQVIYLIYNIDD